ncbi:pilus assembly protein N-terminal domain-containing protein [Vibrio tapetis subsp. quintayensis]|uniref:type II and III secretion system protein family protein n=1 Tax=Vibrio tapetis TaxID=52443 RepID=UPI0025B2D18C|nr:pilus assembly protein N-terminal domain-containing protein [Vibrio tapetis]MDN3681431.1 pilus assembly protein N-terminal domain-containing protein [Vibrio tapetis subsp. quintayensis]
MITKMIKTIALVITLISSCAYAARIVNLAEGDATTIDVPSGISSVFISNPDIADYQVIDQNKVVVFGKQIGSATMMVFDDEGNTQVARKLIVNKSLVHIQQQIQLRYPKADVSIYNLAEQAVLSGTVATQEQKDGIYNLVGELLGKDAEVTNVAWKLGSESYNMDFMQKTKFKGIVNNIDVVSTKQVNVKISVAEVSHSFLENFGVEIGTTEPGVFVDQLTNISASDIISVITALGDDNVGQVLAEPNLSVISGETASFLVGGELPVVTIVDGGTNVLYKEYGIRLELMAKVLRDDKIKLSLMPEVSSLDNQYENATYNLPALKTRRARTTIELGDGQSFVLGGLLNTEDRESLRKIPYIGDIPILGALFRKTGTERKKTELVIVATVNLVEPVKASQIQLPMMERTTNLSRFFAIDTSYPKSEEKWLQQVLASGGFKQ